MFGTYRTVLALCVLFMHLYGLPMLGGYAVFGFYVLSGYLMTLIMHGTYGYSRTGLAKFAINRFLRLYPMYFAVLFFAVALCYFIPSSWVARYQGAMYLPADLAGWLANITFIFPRFDPTSYLPRLVPTTWALTVELFNYGLVAIGFSRSKRTSFLWLTGSLIYVAWTFANELDWTWRYHTIFAGCLPFSIGALIYHYRGLRPVRFIGINTLIAIPPLFLANAYIGHTAPRFFDLCWYMNLGLNAMFLFTLVTLGSQGWFRKYDNEIGKYSYPIYLLHWPVGLLVCYILWDAPHTGRYFVVSSLESLISGAASLALVFLFSFLLIKLIDEKVDKLRASVKRSKL